LVPLVPFVVLANRYFGFGSTRFGLIIVGFGELGLARAGRFLLLGPFGRPAPVARVCLARIVGWLVGDVHIV
jgi:hypothetical protein